MSLLSDFTFFSALLGESVGHCLKVFNPGRGVLAAQEGVYYAIALGRVFSAALAASARDGRNVG